jgi:uncharacterized protein DUF6325
MPGRLANVRTHSTEAEEETVSVDITEMGPVDYMVVEFPGGRTNGKGLPLLVDLVDRGVIRILDLVFLRKLNDGTFVRMELGEGRRAQDQAMKLFEGASSGIVDDGDIKAVSEVVEPGSLAGIIVYENRWAAPLATALRQGGAQLVAGGRIPVQAIIAALDAAEATAPSQTQA